ncbi:hypothetical protein Q1695_006134 [Nippostrongylus brasiliensis]|nr:hypothetical protein Q1695_006134 [Nippostrongylus brasiliensis]
MMKTRMRAKQASLETEVDSSKTITENVILLSSSCLASDGISLYSEREKVFCGKWINQRRYRKSKKECSGYGSTAHRNRYVSLRIIVDDPKERSPKQLEGRQPRSIPIEPPRTGATTRNSDETPQMGEEGPAGDME